MKAKQINKILGFSAIFACAYLVMSAIKRKREGIGRIERIKRRIYKEVSLAQDAGVDFSKKYTELSSAELDALKHIGQDVVGWKQSKRSIESGKPYTESYYASLRRAWNAVSGIEGIGRVYNVKDANGNICLTWIEDAAAHVEAEREIEEKRQRVLEAEQRAAEARKSRQRTRRAIERGETPVTPEEPKPAKPFKADIDEDYKYRKQFAEVVWGEYRKENPYFDDNIPDSVPQWVKDYKKKHNVIADAYARDKMRIRNTRYRGKIVEVKFLEGADWLIAGTFNDNMVQYAQAILDAQNNKNTEEGFLREDLNDIRRSLLDKAQHMHVSVPYDLKDKYKDLMDHNYIRGDNRYKALDLINWILWIHQKYERGGDIFYPMYSFESKEDALRHTGGKIKGNGFKVIPVWEVPIDKISGIGYAPNIETELFEIWREQLDYGDTDYDFDTWKRIYGDEYIKSSILPYM